MFKFILSTFFVLTSLMVVNQTEAKPQGRAFGWKEHLEAHPKGKALGWKRMGRFLHHPLGHSSVAEVSEEKSADGMQVTVSSDNAKAQAVFPAKPKKIHRPGMKMHGVESFVLRRQGVVYFLQVYHDLNRVGLAKEEPRDIINLVDERWQELADRLGGAEEPSVTDGAEGTVVWDATLQQQGRRQARQAFIRQKVVAGPDLFVIATVMGKRMNEARSEAMQKFLGSIQISSVKNGDVMQDEEPYWPAIIEENALTEWPAEEEAVEESGGEVEFLYPQLPSGLEEEEEPSDALVPYQN